MGPDPTADAAVCAIPYVSGMRGRAARQRERAGGVTGRARGRAGRGKRAGAQYWNSSSRYLGSGQRSSANHRLELVGHGTQRRLGGDHLVHERAGLGLHGARPVRRVLDVLQRIDRLDEVIREPRDTLADRRDPRDAPAAWSWPR